MRYKFVYLLLMVIIVITSLKEVKAACVTPPNNNVTIMGGSGYTLCTGTYYNVSFLLNGIGATFDGNGSTIYANSTNTSYKSIDQAYYGRANVTIKNIKLIGSGQGIGIYRGAGFNIVINNVNVSNYSEGVEIDSGNSNYTYIRNSNISGSAKCLANVVIYSGRYINLTNSHFDNSLNLSSCAVPPHGVYFTPLGASTSIDYGYIDNCSFNNNAGEGLHFNGDQAINYNLFTITNSQFINNVRFGLDTNGLSNTTITNNIIGGHTNFGISMGKGDSSLSTINTVIQNNTFYNNSNCDVQGGYGLTSNSNISFINNTFYNASASTSGSTFKMYNKSNILFNGLVNNAFKYSYASDNALCNNSYMLSNYSGYMSFSESNCSLNISNQLSLNPYNDVYNLSNGVVLSNNFDNYTTTLAVNQQIAIGNYQTDTTCTTFNNTAYLNNVANLDFDLATPSLNNVASLDFISTTCGSVTPPVTSCDGTTNCTWTCGTNFTTSVNMRLNTLTFNGTGTTYLLGNITNSTTKVGQCNIKLNGFRLN